MNKLKRADRNVVYTESPPFPKNMLVELTNRCNHKCIFCENGRMKRELGSCNMELMFTIMAQARSAGTEEIGFYLTGEPFMCADLKKYILESKRLGFQYIYLTTNGAMATAEKVEELIDAGLSSMKFSINAGTRKNYMKIHGRDDFDKVISNLTCIYNMKKERSLDFPIFVSFIKTKYTIGEAAILKELLGDKVDDMKVVDVGNAGGKMYEVNSMLAIDKPEEGKCPCPMIFNRLHITKEGYLNACCVDFDNYMAVADLSKVSLIKAWNSRIMVDLRKQHLSNLLDNNRCHNCILNVDNDINPLSNKLASSKNLGLLDIRNK